MLRSHIFTLLNSNVLQIYILVKSKSTTTKKALQKDTCIKPTMIIVNESFNRKTNQMYNFIVTYKQVTHIQKQPQQKRQLKDIVFFHFFWFHRTVLSISIYNSTFYGTFKWFLNIIIIISFIILWIVYMELKRLLLWPYMTVFFFENKPPNST